MFNSEESTQDKQESLELDRAREEHVKQIRKSNRDDIISKKRNLNPDLALIAEEGAKHQRLMLGDNELSDKIDKLAKKDYLIEELPNLAACLQSSSDPVVLHEGIIGLRKLLSADQPPIQRVIDLNLVPKMIDLIKQQTYPYLQMEATWALTNIASGTSTQCQSIVDKGGIPIFIKLLSSPLENNVEQAVWALGNIAGDSHYNRDLILKVGGLAELIRVMETTTNPNIFKQGGWAVANLCRGTPRPSYDSVKNSVTVLARVVKEETITDHEILSDCCWALSYLSDGGKTRIAKVVETGVVPRIVSFLGSDVHKIVIPALRTLGNIATGNENQTEAVLQAGCLNYMQPLLSHKKPLVRREAAWIISNICAGVRSQVHAVLACHALLFKLLDMFDKDTIDIRREIAWAFSNMSNTAEPVSMCKWICQVQLMRYYVELLSSTDDKAIEVGLEGIRNFLLMNDKIKGHGENGMIRELNKYDGITKLEQLQNHKSTVIYKKVYSILETFFIPEDPLA